MEQGTSDGTDPSGDSESGSVTRSLSKWGTIAVGGCVLLLGIILMPLPGPGMLIVVVGFLILAREIRWFDERLDDVRDQAFRAAAFSVQSPFRIAMSLLGIAVMVTVGITWGVGIEIPEFWIFGPELPAQGWLAGGSILVGAAFALGMLVYSWWRWRDLPQVDDLEDMPVPE